MGFSYTHLLLFLSFFNFAAKCSDIIQKDNVDTSNNEEMISQEEVEKEPSDSSEKTNLELDEEPEETEGKSRCSWFNLHHRLSE